MMDKFIQVFDDVIPISMANRLEQIVLNGDIYYKYVPNVTDKSSSKYHPGFSYPLIFRDKDLYQPPCFEFSQILYKLCFKLNISLIDIIQARIFLQIPNINSGRNGIHVDTFNPHWVCLYYVCDSDGDTILFDDNENEIQRVSPKKGRIVFFDGSIKHCSSSPTKTHRAVVNFDFIGKKL